MKEQNIKMTLEETENIDCDIIEYLNPENIEGDVAEYLNSVMRYCSDYMIIKHSDNIENPVEEIMDGESGKDSKKCNEVS